MRLDADGTVEIMAFKMKYKNLKEVVKELQGAVKAHGRQAKVIEGHIKEMETPAKKYVSDAQRKAIYATKADGSAGNPNKMASPMKGKISGPCKAAAKRKFKVWPSAYASGWGVRCTRAGGPGKMGKSKKK